MNRDCLILLLARSPRDEQRAKNFGKAGREAEALHRALVERTLRVADTIESADVRWVTTGDLSIAERFANRCVTNERLEVHAQTAGPLGARLSHAFERAFSDGYRKVVVIGSDTPELTSFDLEQAFERLILAPRSAVLGPAPDGGYYLLGLNAPCTMAAEAFDDRWLGTTNARRAAMAALATDGFTLSELALHADLDWRSDIERVQVELRRSARLEDAILRRLALAVLVGAVRPMTALTRPQARHIAVSPPVRGPPLSL